MLQEQTKMSKIEIFLLTVSLIRWLYQNWGDDPSERQENYDRKLNKSSDQPCVHPVVVITQQSFHTVVVLFRVSPLLC